MSSCHDKRPRKPSFLLSSQYLSAGHCLASARIRHWFIRGWDFPRVQIIAIDWLLLAAYLSVRFFIGSPSLLSAWWFVVPVIALTLWHGFRIAPYTVVFPKQAKSTHLADRLHRDDPSTIRLVISNVEEENDQFSGAKKSLARRHHLDCAGDGQTLGRCCRHRCSSGSHIPCHPAARQLVWNDDAVAACDPRASPSLFNPRRHPVH